MRPTLSDIQAARASARRHRDHNARRLKHIMLKLMTRVEAYEHELSLLTRVERDLISNGRTETRFDEGTPLSAVLTPDAAPGASSAIRRASPIPSGEEPPPPPARYASGDGF